MKKIIDLHTHSTASDGSFMPGELVRHAAESGVTTLALTDHDSTAGLAEAAAESARLGVEFIRGVELTTSTQYGSVDILGYCLPDNDPVLEKKLELLRLARMRRNESIVERLNGLGLAVSMEEITAQGSSSFGRPHIAALMLSKGYINHPREAYQKYIGEGKTAFVPKEPFSPEEAVNLLAGAGAVAFVAHPMLVRAPEAWLDSLVRELAELGLAGLEAYHSEHDAKAVRHVVRLADKYNLLVSGGSDFHGRAKPHIQLGRGRGGLMVPEIVLEKLKLYHAKQLLK